MKGTLTVDSPYEGWPPPPRRPVQERQRRSGMGIRLDPNSSGAGADFARSAEATAPALRKVGVLEILEAPSAPGKVGYPPCMSPDANLGFC